MKRRHIFGLVLSVTLYVLLTPTLPSAKLAQENPVIAVVGALDISQIVGVPANPNGGMDVVFQIVFGGGNLAFNDISFTGPVNIRADDSPREIERKITQAVLTVATSTGYELEPRNVFLPAWERGR